MSWGQFHETKLSVNSSEVERNLLQEWKTRGKFQLKFGEIVPGEILLPTFWLMELAPGVGASPSRQQL